MCNRAWSCCVSVEKKQQGYLYYLLRFTQSNWNKFEAEGTVCDSDNKKDVHEFEVIIPFEILQERFGSITGDMDKQITINEKESHVLTTVRDALLPKLIISGTIRTKMVV